MLLKKIIFIFYLITRSRNRVQVRKKNNKKKARKVTKQNRTKREKKKDPGRIILIGLLTDDYSQASSHYRLARDLLPAAFGPWAGSVLIMQPGRSCGLLRSTHIDARLSAGARST